MAQEASARAGLAGLRGAAPSCSALRAGHPSCTRRIGSGEQQDHVIGGVNGALLQAVGGDWGSWGLRHTAGSGRSWGGVQSVGRERSPGPGLIWKWDVISSTGSS